VWRFGCGTRVTQALVCACWLACSVTIGFAADVETQTDQVSAARAALDAGRYAQALSLYERASQDTSLGTPRMILVWYGIGQAQAGLGRAEEALAAYERSLQFAAQSAPAVKAAMEPRLHHALGGVLRTQGQPARARAEFQRAHDGFEQSNDANSMAQMLVEIGSSYVAEARFGEGLARYRSARALMDPARSPERAELAINTSAVLTWLGQYDDAVALQAEAQRLCGERGDAPCAAYAAHVQSFTRFQMADYEGAAASASRAAELFGKQPTTQRARALNNHGVSLIELNRPKEALPPLRESLAIAQKLDDAQTQATATDSLGTAHRALRDYKMAGRAYQDALLLWRGTANREGERDTLANLGRLATDLKQVDSAIFYYKLSVNLAQSLRADARGLERSLFDALTRRLTPSYQLLTGLLVDQGRIAEAQQVARMLKEQELFEFTRRSGPAGDARSGLSGLEQREREQYESIQQRVFALAQERDSLNKKPSSERSDAVRTRLGQLSALLRQAQDDLERFLVALNGRLAGSGHAQVDQSKLEGLQRQLRALGHGAVMLRYVVEDDGLSVILVGGPSQAIRGRRLAVTRKELNQAIQAMLGQIESVDTKVRITARKLHDWLLPEPVRVDLQDAGAQTLMVSLDDSLRYLPFAALHDGQAWLAERYRIVLYTDQVDSRLGHPPKATWSVRAFGMSRATEGFPPLNWVRTELEGIVGAQGLPGSADFDDDFTEDRLRDAVNVTRPPVLHIASHFVFKPGTEDDSFLLLGKGRLTLTEINQWEFNDLDLLTLSACQTAVAGGANRNGREIEGFGALAQRRGADAVLATLWSVSDPSTAAFMRTFYATRRARPDATKADVLQATQLAMIRGQVTPANARGDARGSVEGDSATARSNDYAEPYYWAPFILFGNWR
jgi:CHAT domain-containing protein